ncbi:MAG: ATP synthase F1 subunit delta [Bacteroidales bacterium]|nr:ATP synthase F1 subunit delta [Bacteroidales bacterium]
MNTNRITVRYAKALFGLASEEEKAERINNDMHLIGETAKIPDFRRFLENPVIFPSRKQVVFNKIFKEKVNELSLRFFKLLSDNKRETYLSSIARNYSELYRKFYGIKYVQLTTTFKIDDKLKKDISDIISTEFKTKVEMTEQVDKEIIGGFVLTVENLQYDASVATKLKNIKKELLKAPADK